MKIDSPDPRGCYNEEPFQTTLRGLASYTVPKIDVLLSTTVQLVDNGDNRLYVDNRRTQIDMRFAKIVRYGRFRADIGVDLYNLLNSNYALGYESNYSYTQANGGTWLNPNSILPPRFARLNFTINY